MGELSHVRELVVVKVGSTSITDDSGAPSLAKMQALADQCATAQRSSHWNLLIVSSGAVAAGRSSLSWLRPTSAASHRQAAAAVGQTRLMTAYEQAFAQAGLAVGQLLITRHDLERDGGQGFRSTVRTLLRNGIVPILNENDTVAADGWRVGNNDALAGLVAVALGAQRLILLTDTNGLYTGDPQFDPDASPISDVWAVTDEIEEMAGASATVFGTGGMRTKVEAARFVTSAGTPVVVASGSEPGVLLRIAQGEPIGTRFHPSSEGVSACPLQLT